MFGWAHLKVMQPTSATEMCMLTAVLRSARDATLQLNKCTTERTLQDVSHLQGCSCHSPGVSLVHQSPPSYGTAQSCAALYLPALLACKALTSFATLSPGLTEGSMDTTITLPRPMSYHGLP